MRVRAAFWRREKYFKKYKEKSRSPGGCRNVHTRRTIHRCIDSCHHNEGMASMYMERETWFFSFGLFSWKGSAIMAEDKEELKFWQKSWFMWVCLIFFAPVGIVLCYVNRERHPKWKIICGVFLVLFVIGMVAPKNNTTTTQTKPTAQTAQTQEVKKTESTQSAQKQETTKTESKQEEQKVPMEYKMALKSAEQYLRTMPFSKQGLYVQLTSDAGSKFPPEAAQYAVDNVKTDWKENAARAAVGYLNIMPMSREELVNQLSGEGGDKYTLEEAQYGVEKAYK